MILYVFFALVFSDCLDRGESYLSPTCIWTIVSNAKYAQTCQILYELWWTTSIAIIHKNLSYIQIIMIFYAFFAELDPALLKEWRTIFIYFFHASANYQCPKVFFVTCKNALMGLILWVHWKIIFIASMEPFTNKPSRSTRKDHEPEETRTWRLLLISLPHGFGFIYTLYLHL